MTPNGDHPDPDRRGAGLALIGYRATGKSTVGRLTAEALGMPFEDCDRVIEARAGRFIAEIFQEQGEPAFRDLEEQALATLVEARPEPVLATGGGVILRAANRRRLRAFGFIVWLRGAPTELARRLEADRAGLAERPALTAAGAIEEIAQVLQARTPLYSELADAVIDVEATPPEEIAARLRDLWAARPLEFSRHANE